MPDILLPSKLVTERITVTFDFNDELEWGETIVAQSVSVITQVGVDSTPSLLLYKVATRSGTVVSQQLQLGIPGVIYKVLCAVTGSTGQVYEKWGHLAVLRDVGINPPILGTVLTSKIYPVEATEGLDISRILVTTGQFVNTEIDGIDANILSISNAIIWGSLESYTHPPEDAIDANLLSIPEALIWGGLISIDAGPDAIDAGHLNIVSALIWGNLVEHTQPAEDGLDTTLSIMSGVIS